MTGSGLARALERALPADADHVELRERASAVLRAHVGYDLAVWATVDPLTAMWTSCVIDGAPRDEALEAAVFANEYGVPDVLKLADLAHGDRVGSLAGATGGDPTSSARFRDVFAPRGVTDELRLVCSDGSTPWGAVVLLRSGGTFSAEEVADVATIGGPFAGRLRRSLLRTAATTTADDGSDDAAGGGTGLVLCAPDGRIRDVSTEARRLLAALSPGDVPAVVGAAVAKHRAGGGAGAALATPGGRWLGFSVTALADSVAVVVEQIRPARLAEIVVRSVGLTPRERDVLEEVLRGASTRQAARALGLSEWTVQDHLKKVFTKFGVTSRAELLSSLFFTHYAPRHGGTPSPSGHFLPDR